MIMCYRIFQRSSVDAPNVVESIERSANAGLVQSMKNMGTSNLAILVLEFNYYCLLCHFILQFITESKICIDQNTGAIFESGGPENMISSFTSVLPEKKDTWYSYAIYVAFCIT